jgi:hypothetical protein
MNNTPPNPNTPNQPPMFPQPSRQPVSQKIRHLADATSEYSRAIVRMAFWLFVTVAVLAIAIGLGHLAVRIACGFVEIVTTSLGL